ncbi:hypothetical protein [Candidatus Filomicrobium marinum]|nr:hypothetical protein [Candidatus Filomicrobium marinum]
MMYGNTEEFVVNSTITTTGRGSRDMTLVRMTTAFVMSAIAAGTMLLPAAVQAQSSCKWYAATALKQQQENERLRCGFTGPAWHSNVPEHMQWCASVSPSATKESAQQRDKMLADCAKR